MGRTAWGTRVVSHPGVRLQIHRERGSWRGQGQDPAHAGGRELQTPRGTPLSSAEDRRADRHLAEPLGACGARSQGEAQPLGLALLPPLTPTENSLFLLCTPRRWQGGGGLLRLPAGLELPL